MVRAIGSPCGNFGWGQTKIVEQSDDSSDTIAGGGTDGNTVCSFHLSSLCAIDLLLIGYSKTHILQIILYHNDYNHNGNVHRETIVSTLGLQLCPHPRLTCMQAMFQPAPWEPRDLALEQQEVISLEQILTTIRKWKDKVQSCAIVDSLVQELTVMATKGLGFPNGMGNEKRYPGPWDLKVWDERVAERKAKEVAYKTKPKRKASKKK